MNIFIKKRSFFENLFSSKEDPWWFSWRATQQYRYHTYLTMLQPFLRQKKGIAFDIGCAQGDFTFQLYKLNAFSKVIGADISQIAVNRANKRFKNYDNISFIRKTLPSIPFPQESVSLILMLEVIYYITHKERVLALKNAYNALEKDGLLFLSTNLGENYFTQSEFETLITSASFKIESTHLVYGMIYWRFEHYPLKWYESLRNYEIRTKTSPFFTRIPINIIKSILSSFRLFEFGSKIGKMIGEKPCLMYVIAKKIEK